MKSLRKRESPRKIPLRAWVTKECPYPSFPSKHESPKNVRTFPFLASMSHRRMSVFLPFLASMSHRRMSVFLITFLISVPYNVPYNRSLQSFLTTVHRNVTAQQVCSTTSMTHSHSTLSLYRTWVRRIPERMSQNSLTYFPPCRSHAPMARRDNVHGSLVGVDEHWIHQVRRTLPRRTEGVRFHNDANTHTYTITIQLPYIILHKLN